MSVPHIDFTGVLAVIDELIEMAKKDDQSDRVRQWQMLKRDVQLANEQLQQSESGLEKIDEKK